MMHREVGKGEKRKYAQKSQVLGTLLPSIITLVSPSNSTYYERSFFEIKRIPPLPLLMQRNSQERRIKRKFPAGNYRRKGGKRKTSTHFPDSIDSAGRKERRRVIKFDSFS